MTFSIWKICKSDPKATHSRLESDVTKIQSGGEKKAWDKFWSIIFTKSPIMPFHFIQFLWKAGEMMHIYQCGVILYSVCLWQWLQKINAKAPSKDSRALLWVPLSQRRAAPVIIWSSWMQSLKFALGSRVCRRFLPWTLPVGFANIQAEYGHPEATPKQLCF